MSVGSNPAFPIIPYNPYAYAINHINIAISRKLLKTTIRLSKQTLQIMRVLQAVGCVKNFYIWKKKYKYITFSVLFYRNKSFYHGIRLISTPSKKFYISLKTLKRLKCITKSSVYLISTSHGLITHDEALERKIGGMLLCAIN